MTLLMLLTIFGWTLAQNSTMHPQTISTQITVVIESQSMSEEAQLSSLARDLFQEIFGDSYLATTDSNRESLVSMNIVPLNRHRTGINHTNVVDRVRASICERMIEKQLIVILLHPSAPHSMQMRNIAYSLSFYSVPVVDASDRTVQHLNKGNVIRILPSWHRQGQILVRLLALMQYTTIGLIVEYQSDECEQFSINFEAAADSMKIEIQTKIGVTRNGNWSAYSQLLADGPTNVWVMDASPEMSSKIFTEFVRQRPNIIWLLSERAMSAPNIPQGSLTIKAHLQDAAGSLMDAMVAARSALEKYRAIAKKIQHIPSATCNDTKYNEFRRNLLSRVPVLDLTSTIKKASVTNETDGSAIAFDVDSGRRILAAYDLLNRNSRMRWAVVGQYRLENNQQSSMIIDFNESAVEWPQNKTIKPSAVALPTHLQVVCVEDRPFMSVLHHNVARPEDCNSNLPTDTIKLPCRKLGATRSSVWQCCQGLAIDMIEYLRTATVLPVGFTISLHYTNVYGAKDIRTGKWNGMIGNLLNGESDLAIGALSISDARSAVVDFSIPWLYHGITILEKNPYFELIGTADTAEKLGKQRWIPRQSALESFMQPFRWDLWVSIVAALFIMGTAMFILDGYSPFERYKRKLEERELDERPLGLDGALLFVWGVLLDSGIGERSPRGLAARVVGMTWCGFSMIMVASYTANLAAFLVLDEPKTGVSGITDTRLRNPSGNFTFATVRHSRTHEYFRRQIELATMARLMERTNYPTSEQAITAVKNGELDAFIWDSTFLEYLAAKDCSLGISGALFGQSAYGIALQQDSPWTRLLSLAVLHLIENGTIERLENKWITDVNEGWKCPIIDKAPARLALKNMKDGFILIACGVAAGLILCLIERRYRLRKLRSVEQKKATEITSDDHEYGGGPSINRPSTACSCTALMTPPRRNAHAHNSTNNNTKCKKLQVQMSLESPTPSEQQHLMASYQDHEISNHKRIVADGAAAACGCQHASSPCSPLLYRRSRVADNTSKIVFVGSSPERQRQTSDTNTEKEDVWQNQPVHRTEWLELQQQGAVGVSSNLLPDRRGQRVVTRVVPQKQPRKPAAAGSQHHQPNQLTSRTSSNPSLRRDTTGGGSLNHRSLVHYHHHNSCRSLVTTLPPSYSTAMQLTQSRQGSNDRVHVFDRSSVPDDMQAGFTPEFRARIPITTAVSRQERTSTDGSGHRKRSVTLI